MINNERQNKHKLINDPVFGFILVPYALLFHLIEHPYLQRLKRIKQLGLSHYVYPGAQHTRFQHILGAMHLMEEAVKTLRDKKVEITKQEEKAVLAAILLHDIGHGPFSHALENSIVPVHHEQISLLTMQHLNEEFKNKLDLAIQIFQGTYHKQFLHQLVSSQLDMDRMDYLRRDSFFTGVIEGTIGSARIIKMLNVHEDKLVLDAKGIYSIEKFLVARRLMYWQVYLHKTSLAAEQMLINVLKRAKELVAKGEKLFGTEDFLHFLENEITREHFVQNPSDLRRFLNLDDTDITVSIKSWQNHPDFILSTLSKGIIQRNLYKTEVYNKPLQKGEIDELKKRYAQDYGISIEETDYFVFERDMSKSLISTDNDNVQILFKNGKTEDITTASDLLNTSSLEDARDKYYLCYFKKESI